MDGASVPASVSPAVAASTPMPPGTAGRPSVRAATGRVARAAATNWTAVTATGSRPGSRRAWATVKAAEKSRDARTRPSPAKLAPSPPPAATRPTPASDSAKPDQATGRATLAWWTAARKATSTGVAPTSRAAWLTLVRVIPAFWIRIDPPYPTAPQASTAGLQAARTRNRVAAEEHGGGQAEPGDGEPARRQPLQGELGQGHAGAPEQAGAGERGHSGSTVGGHATIVLDAGPNHCR